MPVAGSCASAVGGDLDDTEKQLEDQGDWERCLSFRRMFLALADAGWDDELDSVAKKLLKLTRKHLPKDNTDAKAAKDYWRLGLCDEKRPHKELAYRTYLVMHYTARAFDGMQPRVIGGGEALVCGLIRQELPLAPKGFRKVAKMTGDPKSPGDYVRQLFVTAMNCRPLELPD